MSDDPLTYDVDYEPEEGLVVTRWNSTIEEIIHVRAELKEKALRAVVIIELERLGYAVIPPEEQP